MKIKTITTIIIASFISVFVLSYCLYKVVDRSNHYEIRVVVDFGEDSYEQYSMEAGDTLLLVKTPVRDGYEFEGWYADEEYTTPFDFDADIGRDTTIYAKMRKL